MDDPNNNAFQRMMQNSRDFGIRRGVSANFMPLGNIGGQEYQREYHQRRRHRQRQDAMRRARSLSPVPAPGDRCKTVAHTNHVQFLQCYPAAAATGCGAPHSGANVFHAVRSCLIILCTGRRKEARCGGAGSSRGKCRSHRSGGGS